MEEHRSFVNRMFRFILPVLILSIGAGVLYAAYALKPKPKKEVSEVRAPTVETVTIEAYEKGLTIEVDGSVVPLREISLATEVSGRVKRKSPDCEAGQFVKSGSLLFEIDPVDYDLEVRRLSKELRQAEIRVHSNDVEQENTRTLIKLAEEDLKLQENEVARLRSLVSGKAASRSELDRAKRNEVAARNSLALLKNQTRMLVTQRASHLAAMDLANTQLERAEINLQRTKVLAPIDGVIVRELVEEDAFVQRGAPLVEIEDTSVAEVRCSLRMDQLYWLWNAASDGEPNSSEAAADDMSARDYEIPTTPATVIYRIAGREFHWEGRLDRYDGSGIDPATRTVPCRIVVENPRKSRSVRGSTTTPPALVRGMFVSVELHIEPNAQLARIPLKALQPGNRIWLVDNGRLRIEDVRIARLTDEFALLETFGRFEIGDKVITTPLPSPKDGMRIDDGSQVAVAEAGATDKEGVAGQDSESNLGVENESDPRSSVDAAAGDSNGSSPSNRRPRSKEPESELAEITASEGLLP